MRPKTICIVVIVSILLLGTGILSATGTQEPVGAPEITLIAGSWVQGTLDTFEETHGYSVLGRFEEQTGIRVKVELHPFRELFQAIEVYMNAKSTEVDVLYVDAPLTSSYAVRGFLIPVGNNLTEEEQKRFFPATLRMATWNGELFTYPFENSSQVMYVNKELFRRAGITIPSRNVDERLTWEEVVDIAKKIQLLNEPGETKIWGLLFDQISRPYQMLAIPQSAGAGSGVSPDGLYIDGYLNNEGWIGAMEWWYDLNNTLNIIPPGIGPEQTEGVFATGDVGLYVGGPWHIGAFMQAKEEGRLDFDIVPHPYFRDGKPATATNGWHLGVSRYSDNPEAAVQFIKYITSDDIMKDWFSTGLLMTANTVMAEVIAEDPYFSEFPHNSWRDIVIHELANSAEPRPTTPLYLEWEDQVAKAFEDIRNGADPKETLDLYVDILERSALKYR